LQPDLTLLFDAPIAVARERLERGTVKPDKFEREQADFFARVRLAYLNRAVEFAERIKVIDSAQSIRTIRAELVQHLEQLLDSARA
jgi:dTMP kinase